MSKLIFTYKMEDKGFINGMFDFFHKLMVPSTYVCTNCEVTHNYTGMRTAWKSYLEWLPIQIDFYNEKMFSKAFPESLDVVFPCIFIQDAKTGLKLVISNAELKDAGLSELTTLINKQVVSCRLKKEIQGD